MQIEYGALGMQDIVSYEEKAVAITLTLAFPTQPPSWCVWVSSLAISEIRFLLKMCPNKGHFGSFLTFERSLCPWHKDGLPAPNAVKLWIWNRQ